MRHLTQRFSILALVSLLLTSLGCKKRKATPPAPNEIDLFVDARNLHVSATINGIRSFSFPEDKPTDEGPSDPLYVERFRWIDEHHEIDPWIRPGENTVVFELAELGEKTYRAEAQIRHDHYGNVLDSHKTRDTKPFTLRFTVSPPSTECPPISEKDDQDIRSAALGLIRAIESEDWATVRQADRDYELHPLGDLAFAQLKSNITNMKAAGASLDTPTKEELRLARDCWQGGVWVDRIDHNYIYTGYYETERSKSWFRCTYLKAREADGKWVFSLY